MMTTHEIAARLGISTRRVLQLAAEIGIMPAGIKVRAKLWRDEDAKLIMSVKRRPIGRPRNS